MKTLIVAPRAQRDLTEIFSYIAHDNNQSAHRFLDEITNKLEWIARTNFAGVNRDWIRAGLRACIFKKRCIYFRSDETTVSIVRIVHERQDISQVNVIES